MSKKGHVSYPRGDSNVKFVSPLYPSPIYSLCLQKIRTKDPKHVRQEVSEAGKRMWPEKSGFWGWARANTQHRSEPGEGVSRQKRQSQGHRLKVNGRLGTKHLPKRRVWSTQRVPENLQPENGFCCRRKGLAFSSSLLGKETVCTKPTWQN